MEAVMMNDVLGLSIQPMECSSSSLLFGPLLSRHLPLVDSSYGVDLCQSTIYEYSGVRILRRCLHDIDSWQPHHCPLVLRDSFKANGDTELGHYPHAAGKHDTHPSGIPPSKRRELGGDNFNHLGDLHCLL